MSTRFKVVHSDPETLGGEPDMEVEGRLIGGDEEPQSFKSRNSALPLSAPAHATSAPAYSDAPNFH